MQLWELNSLSWSVVKAGSGKKSRLLTLHQEQSCDVERRGEIHVVVAVRAACADFLSLLGQRAEGLFSARGEQIYHDFITAGVSASFAFFFFFLLFHSSSPPFSHISYVLVKAEKSLTSWVPETKLVGGRSGGTSPCAPPPPSRSAFVQGRGEKRHTEVKIKRNMPLGWSRRGTMQDLTPADGEAPRNSEVLGAAGVQELQGCLKTQRCRFNPWKNSLESLHTFCCVCGMFALLCLQGTRKMGKVTCCVWFVALWGAKSLGEVTCRLCCSSLSTGQGWLHQGGPREPVAESGFPKSPRWPGSSSSNQGHSQALSWPYDVQYHHKTCQAWCWQSLFSRCSYVLISRMASAHLPLAVFWNCPTLNAKD